jgi:DNA-binding FadR family transcriptional regulator
MVAESAHNTLLLSIFDAFNSIRTQAAWAKLRREASTPERREDYRRQHRDYVAAIAARDPARATEMMRRHIEAVREGLYSASAKPVRPAFPRGKKSRERDRPVIAIAPLDSSIPSGPKFQP